MLQTRFRVGLFICQHIDIDSILTYLSDMKEQRQNSDKRGKGRPPKEIDEELAVKCAIYGHTNDEIADMLGVTRPTFWAYCNSHPDFFNTIREAKVKADINVAHSLYKRANGYTYNEITQEVTTSEGAQKARHNPSDYELTDADWGRALTYFNNQCAYCGSTGDITKDHIHPIALGGRFEAGNIIPACGSCNSSKKHHPLDEWYPKQPFYTDVRYELIRAFSRLEMGRERIGLAVTKIVTKDVPPDTRAGEFWLRNRQPDKFREKQEVEHSGTGFILKLEEVKPDGK